MNNEFIGTFRFFVDNKLVHEEKNALTSAGRAIAIKSLLGLIPKFADSISYGIDSTANIFNSASTLITNNTMGFEIGRSEVIINSYELVNARDSLVFSTEILDPYQYTIHEIGLFPSTDRSNNLSVDAELLFDFDLIDDFSKSGTASTASLTVSSSARIGSRILNLPVGGSATGYIEKVFDNGSLSDLNAYVSKDLFKMSGINFSSSAASIFVRFYTDDSNHYTVPFITSTSSGYFIVNTEKGSSTVSGSPNWDTVSKVRIWNSSASTVQLDGMKIDYGSYLLDTNFGMISRAVLATPVLKPASVPVTVEYNLVMKFDGGN